MDEAVDLCHESDEGFHAGAVRVRLPRRQLWPQKYSQRRPDGGTESGQERALTIPTTYGGSRCAHSSSSRQRSHVFSFHAPHLLKRRSSAPSKTVPAR